MWRKAVLFLALTPLFAAAGIEGKWTGETKMKGPRGREINATVVLDAHASADGFIGTLSFGNAQRGGAEIENGQLHGDKVTFSTTVSDWNDDLKIKYEGTLSGDQLHLTRRGGKNLFLSDSFTLKRVQ